MNTKHRHPSRAECKSALNRAISIASTSEDPIIANQAGAIAEFLQRVMFAGVQIPPTTDQCLSGETPGGEEMNEVMEATAQTEPGAEKILVDQEKIQARLENSNVRQAHECLPDGIKCWPYAGPFEWFGEPHNADPAIEDALGDAIMLARFCTDPARRKAATRIARLLEGMLV